jgi:hypothetical protein
VPFGVNHRYDFALDLGDRFLRVQCKTGRLRGGRIVFKAQSSRTNTRRPAQLRSYHGEIDLFAVYCVDTDRVYAIPVDEATRTEASLRVRPASNGQRKRIRWAEDYLLERQLSPA